MNTLFSFSPISSQWLHRPVRGPPLMKRASDSRCALGELRYWPFLSRRWVRDVIGVVLCGLTHSFVKVSSTRILVRSPGGDRQSTQLDSHYVRYLASLRAEWHLAIWWSGSQSRGCHWRRFCHRLVHDTCPAPQICACLHPQVFAQTDEGHAFIHRLSSGYILVPMKEKGVPLLCSMASTLPRPLTMTRTAPSPLILLGKLLQAPVPPLFEQSSVI
jgi:hypothetical protein